MQLKKAIFLIPVMLFAALIFPVFFQPTWHNVEDIETGKDSVALVGAGDISVCGNIGDDKTAAILDRFDGTIAAFGDISNGHGMPDEYEGCFAWGRYKNRIMPAAGNHDYIAPDAYGYYSYFGSRAGDPSKGYYSYNLGKWHVIVLNSNCEKVGGCDMGSGQGKWLKEDLAMNPSACTLAYFHHPPFSSEGDNDFSYPLWKELHESGADLVLTGHEHSYERFHPLDGGGKRDDSGMQLIIVGTGGAPMRREGATSPLAAVRNTSDWGVIKLILNPESYSWEFIPVDGASFTDSGTRGCR